jgi:hypothetical protein
LTFETFCLVLAALLLAVSLGGLVGCRTADTHWREKHEWRRLQPWEPPATKPAADESSHERSGTWRLVRIDTDAPPAGDLDGARRAYGRAAIAAMREEWRRRREGSA